LAASQNTVRKPVKRRKESSSEVSDEDGCRQVDLAEIVALEVVGAYTDSNLLEHVSAQARPAAVAASRHCCHRFGRVPCWATSGDGSGFDPLLRRGEFTLRLMRREGERIDPVGNDIDDRNDQGQRPPLVTAVLLWQVDGDPGDENERANKPGEQWKGTTIR
jgi:hypothetical protein